MRRLRRARAASFIAASVFAVAAGILVVPRESRGQALYCGRSLVLPGDTQAEVLRKCGPPTRRLVLGKSRATMKPGGRSAPRAARSGRGRETWVYDMGSRQLVRFVSFERGRVVAIELGGYGS